MVAIIVLAWIVVVTSAIEAAAQSGPSIPDGNDDEDAADTQSWNDLLVVVPVNERVDFNLTGSWRFGNDLSRFINHRVGVGFSLRAGDHILIAPSYVNIVTVAGGRPGTENRLVVAQVFRFSIKRLAISDRNQVERRLRQPFNSTRYRNRLLFEHPVRISDLDFRVFASSELFYDPRAQRPLFDRLVVGASRTFNERFTGDLYYVWQNDLHVIGTAVRVRL